MVSINFEGAKQFYAKQPDKTAAQAAFDTLVNGTGAGNDFIGWVDLPVNYDKEEFARIQKAAKKIQSDSKALVVIGIGGSYLGARAVVELLKSPNYNALPKNTPDIYFAGNGISSDAVTEILAMIGDRDFSVNVISKSGTTTEPAIAFRIFKATLEKKYGVEGAKSRIYATTDKARGALKTLASREGYESFVVPDNVGGRYSVLTAVGLLPIACCGIDIEALMHGAQAEREDTLKRGVESAAVQYAMSRQALYADGKNIEILAAYEPAFRFMAEWWKQLYGESEGKDGKGIFPASVDLTPDLHSMGQYIQDGIRMLQETVVFFDNSRTSVTVPSDEENLDGLNYLAGRLSSICGRSIAWTAKTDWAVTDIITASQAAEYRRQIQDIRDALAYPAGTPDAPELGRLTYTDANNIERILKLCEDLIVNVAKSFRHTGAAECAAGGLLT